MRSREVFVARLLLCAYVVLPAVLVLGPLPVHLLDSTTESLRWALPGPVDRQRHEVEILGNIAMFVPVGLLLALGFPRLPPRTLVLTCLCASVAMELMQLVALKGRHPSLRDVALNTLGGVIGVGAACGIRRVRSRARA